MRAFVTGGAGFIGSNLVDALTAEGFEVVAFDNLSSGKRENLAQALDQGATLIEGDITDAASVGSAMQATKPELVFHLAAQIDVRHSVADPIFDLGVNVGGTINVLEAARSANARRVIFASTGGAIYGEGADRELPLGEDAEQRPDAPYGQSKLAAEGYLGLYSRLRGISTAALRLGNVYGPRQDPHGEAGVVAIFCGALLSGQPTLVFGTGEQTRDYIYVGDVVSGFLAAARSDATGPFNIGTGIETSVLDLGARIASACGIAFEPEHRPEREGEVQRISISPARAQQTLGWSAAASLDEGLARTVEWTRTTL